MTKIILGELEEDNDPDSDEDNFGRGLTQRIKEYKANNENWTGQELSNIIYKYMI